MSPTVEDHRTHITVAHGMSGWFAVKVWWNPDLGGFWEPLDTGGGRYRTRQEANQEARDWAECEELPLRNIKGSNE